MSLVFTPLAEQDLEAIADYIAADNPARAVVRILHGARDLPAAFDEH
jgi:toxin ParE1/3/4